MEDIPNLRYFNLSAVANTGFDGYYDFAKFSLEHNPKLQAILLYITFNHLPEPATIGGDKAGLGAAKIHDAYVGPWSFIALPSFALRPMVTNYAYSMFGELTPLRKGGITDNSDAIHMIRSTEEEGGWWRELYGRKIGEKHKAFFDNLCGADDVLRGDPKAWVSPDGEFLPLVTFRKFAALAKSHDKKLLIVFHPHPCGRLNAEAQQALETAVKSVKREYPNVFVYPEHLFEHWPREVWIDQDHLYVGYEYFSTRRVARFLASTLGLPAKDEEKIRLPRTSITLPNEVPFWTTPGFGEGWLQFGTTTTPDGALWRLSETDKNERHYLQFRLPGVVPDRYYLAAITFKPIGDRMLHLILRDNVHMGITWCDPQGLEAGRHADSYDGNLVEEPDGFFTCWTIVKLVQDTAFLGIELLPRGGGFPYQGDGKSGMMVKDLRIYARTTPDVVVDTGMKH